MSEKREFASQDESQYIGSKLDLALLSSYRHLLDRFMPCSILVTDEFELLHTFAGAEQFLHLGHAKANSHVVELMHQDLRPAVAEALSDARESQAAICVPDIEFSNSTDGGAGPEGRNGQLQISIEPIRVANTQEVQYLIAFESHSSDRPQPSDALNTLNEESKFAAASTSEIGREQSLDDQRDNFAEIIDSTPDFVATINHDREVTFLNRSARKMFGIADNVDLQPISIEKFHTPKAVGTVQEGLKLAATQGRWQGESELLLPNGAALPVSQVIVAHRTPGSGIVNYSTFMRDVSPIHESKRALRESEIYLRRIIDNMLSFVGLLSLDGTLIEANLTAIRAGGIDRQDVIGKKFWECVWWSHNEYEMHKLRDAVAAAAQGEVIRYDAEIRVMQDARMTIDFMMVPVRNELGEVTHIVPSGVDVTARKEAEKALHLRQIAIQSATNGILITDATREDLPIVYVNEGFTGMTGYTEADALGQNCRFLQGPDTDPDDVLCIREALKNAEACRVTLLNYRKNGQPFWNDLQITPVQDESGKLISFVGIQHDITDQVEAEERATEVAERIMALLDSTAEGIYGIDLKGNCVFCNRACVEMLGYESQEELVGKNMHTLIHHTHQDGSEYQEVDCPIFSAFLAGENAHVDDEHFWRKDGSSYPVEYWSHPIRRGGKLTGAVVTFLDTTLRLQEQAELEQAREEADAANRAKSQFLANISHELRTPLAVIMGFSDIIAGETEEASVKDRLNVIRRNGEYLLKLLNDILDLTRVETGVVKIEPQDCDFQTFLTDLNEMMQIRADESKCSLHFKLNNLLPAVIATDEARLRQILVNIIGNAIKFSPKGHVDVVVEISKPAGRHAVCFHVIDNGIGMSPEHFDQLFQPFNQANEDIQRDFGGTGLGLSISKRLVDSLGGQIQVKSEIGKGSTFSVSIPFEPTGELTHFQLLPIGEMEEPVSSENVTNRALHARVLLADDMRDVRFVAKHFLEKAACEVTVAENGKEALEAIVQAAKEGRPFDIAVIDIQMPIMDGLETITELRDRGLQLPTIALTADAMKGTRSRVLKAGFDHYVSKPIDAKKLIGGVAKLLSRSES